MSSSGVADPGELSGADPEGQEWYPELQGWTAGHGEGGSGEMNRRLCEQRQQLPCEQCYSDPGL